MATRYSQQMLTAASTGGNLSLNLKLPCCTCCREQFSLKNTDHKNCRYMDYMQESRATAAYHVNAIAVQQVALLVAFRVNVP